MKGMIENRSDEIRSLKIKSVFSDPLQSAFHPRDPRAIAYCLSTVGGQKFANDRPVAPLCPSIGPA
ncbi:MAG: hypothetical protein C0467_28080 [Planctomycetaceae bacterium]|nr:hypothetical protein [Planctomycetaceae bacterium]